MPVGTKPPGLSAFLAASRPPARARRGFTDGVTSSFAPRRGPGPFAVSTAVENAVTGAAVGEILGEVEAIVEDELPHFADRHAVRRVGEEGDLFELPERDNLDDRARIEVVSRDDRDLVRPAVVDGGPASSPRGVIDRIIVHEGRDMQQIDDGPQLHGIRRGAPSHAVGEEEQGGPEELPGAREQVVAHLVKGLESRWHHPAELALDGKEPVRYGQADLFQIDGGGREHTLLGARAAHEVHGNVGSPAKNVKSVCRPGRRRRNRPGRPATAGRSRT